MVCIWRFSKFLGARTWSGLRRVGKWVIDRDYYIKYRRRERFWPQFRQQKIFPFSCFSLETGQDTMKEVQGASTDENTSFKSAITIFSAVVNDYTDYHDHVLSTEASEKYVNNFCSNLSKRRIVHERLSREGLLLSRTLRVWDVENLIVMKTKTKCVLHRANWDELLIYYSFDWLYDYISRIISDLTLVLSEMTNWLLLNWYFDTNIHLSFKNAFPNSIFS